MCVPTQYFSFGSTDIMYSMCLYLWTRVPRMLKCMQPV